MKIAIMTDVNAGLDYIGYDSGIACLRSSVNFLNEVLVDGIDIKADEFYERIKNITDPKDIPSTSAPAIGDIMDTIEKFIEEGKLIKKEQDKDLEHHCVLKKQQEA